MSKIKRLLMFRRSGVDLTSMDCILNDTYFKYIQGIIASGIIDEAHIIYFNCLADNFKSQTCQKGKIFIHLCEKDSLPKLKCFKEKFEFFFVRGIWNEYFTAIKKIKYHIGIFYSANINYVPKKISLKKFDLVYVDDKKHIVGVQKKYPKIKTVVLDKPINEKFFYPKKTIKKYDLCYVANFRPWKYHNMICRAIHKLPQPYKIKCIFVGNLYATGYETNIMMKNYQVNYKLTGGKKLKEVADIIRQSKFTVVASDLDANPRTISESIACDVPVLVNAELVGGLHLINKKTGYKCKLEKFDQGINYMIKNYKNFTPHAYYQQNLTLDKIINRCFVKPLKEIKK